MMEDLPALHDHDAWDALACDIAADESDWSGAVSHQLDPYSVLNISRASSVHDVRARYRQMSLLFHPDRHAVPGSRSSSVFPIVSAANTTLSEPSERAAFDVLGGSADHSQKSHFDAFSETLLTRAELEQQVAHAAIQSELQRRQRVSACELDVAIGPGPGATEVQSQVQFDIGTGYDAIGVSSSLSKSAKARAAASVQLFWSRTHDVWTSSKLALSLASTYLSLDAIGTRRLSATTTGHMCLGLRAHLRRVFTLWFRVSHAFSTAVLGTLTLTLSPRPTLSVNIKQRFQPKQRGIVSISGGFRVLGLSSGLEHRVQYRLSRRYHVGVVHGTLRRLVVIVAQLFVEVRGFVVDSSLELGVCRRFVRAAGLSLSYSFTLSDADGIFLNLIVERGACRLRLPMSLTGGDDAEINAISPYWKLLMALPLIAQVGALAVRSRWRPELSAQGHTYVRQRREAMQWQRQHRAESRRIAMMEEDGNGLVIVDAQYGDVGSNHDAPRSGTPDGDGDHEDRHGMESLFPAIIDAVVPLQMLVRDGRLEIHGSIASIPGLFPVRHSPHCRLHVRYRYDYVDHDACVADGEVVNLPNPSHITQI